MNNTGSTYCPVVIPTLCRFQHLKRCVVSLASCTNANNTDLYIALDYPLKENHREGYKEIKNFVKNINGFKSVNIIEREENFGPEKNAYDAISYVLNQHDRFILSEDDNEFSPNFLEHINNSLKKFETDEKVLAVTGYNRMIDTDSYLKNIYAAKSYSAWGVGFLRNDFQHLLKEVITLNYAIEILRSWKKSFIIFKRYPSVLQGLLSALKKGKVAGDTMVVSYMVLNDKYCIWPTLSKVRNHGFDGGGEHFGNQPNHPLLKQNIDDSKTLTPDTIEIKESNIITKRTLEYAKQPFLKNLLFNCYVILRFLVFKTTGKIIYK